MFTISIPNQKHPFKGHLHTTPNSPQTHPITLQARHSTPYLQHSSQITNQVAN